MEKEKKKSYEKPVLKTMELRADETLAVGCKMTTPSTGGHRSPCTSIMGSCAGAGS